MLVMRGLYFLDWRDGRDERRLCLFCGINVM